MCGCFANETSMTFSIELRPAGSGAICRSILTELPHWFGLPASNAEYEQLAETGPAWVALDDHDAIGLMVLKPHFEDTLEIELLAVRPALHRRGGGRALVTRAEALAVERGARFLTVKTRGPSAPDEPYSRTRAFYRAMGFAALEEFTEIWGPENPALLMAKSVAI
jgi:N-acetylglutamate synthase-like GNAT family acetyltransferase